MLLSSTLSLTLLSHFFHRQFIHSIERWASLSFLRSFPAPLGPLNLEDIWSFPTGLTLTWEKKTLGAGPLLARKAIADYITLD
jgi:hypothetical protein